MRALSVIAILIAYGSLYPGDFSVPEPGALETFLTNWRLFTSRGDLLGNVALFLPLGMASMSFRPTRLSLLSRVAWLLFFAFVYSFALQLAQVWLPSRTAALADVVWNMAGMALGMGAIYLIRKRLPEKVYSFESPLLAPLSVLVLWILTELLPLVPSLDLQKLRDALKPLVLEFNISFADTIMHAAGVVVAGAAFAALGRPLTQWLGASLVFVLVGKLLIVNLTLSASILAGMLAGYLGCLFALHLGGRKVFDMAFWLLLAAGTITAITPFSPAAGGTFNAIPFATMLEGSMAANAQGLTSALFIYTGLLWLAQREGFGIWKAAVGLLIWSWLIELIQMGLLGRTADITQPILILLVGWVLSAMQRSQPASTRSEPEGQVPRFPGKTVIPAGSSGKRAVGFMVIGITLSVVFAAAIMQSALIPYNVRELVYAGHPLRSLVLLACLLYWAVGFPVLIAQWLARGGLFLLSFPPLVLLHGLVAWILLWSSVPSESIHDIVGSPVLSWSWEWERLGRFVALFSFYSVAATGGSLIAALRVLNHRKWAILGWVIGVCVMTPISYYVVVVLAATDNLVELIADHGSIGSFLLIGLAIATMSFGGTKGALALIPGTGGRKTAIAWVVGMGILAYWSLYFGTEQIIIKYNQVFSALQFLLSSEREQLAEPNELIMRYVALYSLFVAAIMMVQYPLWRWMRLRPSPDRAAG